MIKLHRFFETESSIYLLLDHANGGKLKTYIQRYLRKDNAKTTPEYKDNMYKGHNLTAVAMDTSQRVTETCDSAHLDTESFTPDAKKISEFSPNTTPLAGVYGVDSDAIPTNSNAGGDMIFKDILKTSQEKSMDHFTISSDEDSDKEGSLLEGRACDTRGLVLESNCDAGIHEISVPSVEEISIFDQYKEHSVDSQEKSVIFNKETAENMSESSESSHKIDMKIPEQPSEACEVPTSACDTLFPYINDTIISNTQTHLPEDTVKQWAAQIALVIIHLHEAGIVIR